MEVFQLGVLLSTLLAIVYALHFCKKINSKSKMKLPPSPPTLPIIGNLHQIGWLPHRSFWELSRKHGSLMLLHIGSKRAILVSSAKVAKEILKTHDLLFAGRPDHALASKKLFYDMKDLVHLPYGDQWRKLRSIFVHDLLSTTRVKSFESIIEEEVARLMGKIKKCCFTSSPVNLTDTFKALVNDWICRAAFGKKLSETRHGKQFLDVVDEASRLFFTFTIGEFIPWLGWINNLSGYSDALDRCSREIDEVIDAIIDDHLRSRSENSNGESFMDILTQMYEGNVSGVSLDHISVKCLIADVLGAGTETSSAALVWVMTELIRHPKVMKKLGDEVREIMKGKQCIRNNDLHDMQYLKAVIKETLRLHPPIGINVHAARECVNLMGYNIPKGTTVLINMWGIGQDPNCWHEPEKFIPERFLNSSVDFKGLDFELIPFGAGRRICPGLGFAAHSIEYTVANLMHKFDWALAEGAKGEGLDVIETPGFVLAKKNPLVVVPIKCYF